ncbi:solute carrier family 22 member 8 [Plakobranchus ocellatus]|uniref:Solute carrier family 22 member 8 n=1 Tax=Plakobranchus ocellatus TaxID=259542 RepID=A0AAV4AKE9_9GAST|nr:solute carrier family 22 member 8 [Plakobranchus ocellatus]
MATNSGRKALNQEEEYGLSAAAAPRLTKENSARVDVDDVWHYLGRYGRYQVINILLLAFSVWPQSVSILSGVFVGMSVNHRCHNDEAASLQLSDYSNGSEIIMGECTAQVVVNTSSGPRVDQETKCSKFQYDSDVPTSFLAEWDLVCGSETLGQLPQMLTMLGMMVGAVTLPPVGDRFGRKTLGLASHFCHLLVSVGLAYVPAFEFFLLLKFLSGAFNQGFMVTQFIMLMELLPTELRTFMSLLATMLWVFSVLSLVPFAYLFMGYNWRTLQLAYGLISLSSIALLCMDESLRWLLVNRKVKRASRLLKKACRHNGKSYETLLKRVLREDVAATNGENHHPLLQNNYTNKEGVIGVGRDVGDETAKINPSFRDVLRSNTMRNISFIVTYSWMVSSLTYYGITLLSTSLAGDPYLNFLIGGLLEIPSTICMFICLSRFGRKTVAIGFTGAAGVSLLAAVLVATLAAKTYSLSLVQTALTLFGKFCISASFNTMWLYTPELYPTNLRNVGTGMSSMGARLAASASPFFSILARKAIWAPGALFSAACFLCVFLLSFLPETKFRELPSTIAEVEAWYVHDRQAKKSKNGSLTIPGQFTKVIQAPDNDDGDDIDEDKDGGGQDKDFK